MVDVNSQILGMTGCVSMARDKNKKLTKTERCSSLTMALMHASAAAVLTANDPHYVYKYGFSLDDYKHALRDCIQRIMTGEDIDRALQKLKDFE